MAKGITEATTKIYEQLEHLAPEERRRAVDAALTMLGEPATDSKSAKKEDKQQEEAPLVSEFPSSAKAWIRRNKLESSAIAEMFNLENGEFHLDLDTAIGNSKREQTLNTYLLTGVAAFLGTGAASFADASARQNCDHLGCYDPANHAVYVKKEFANKIKGSKNAGWKLTAPGLSAAAKLIQSHQEANE